MSKPTDWKKVSETQTRRLRRILASAQRILEDFDSGKPGMYTKNKAFWITNDARNAIDDRINGMKRDRAAKKARKTV